ncbi:SurA N-terminal domain-containing protein [Kitasatospora sp. RB6PN24]|uniref:SurA N-terminal domain-containing protein n=1 Tax=Kitasatospora humi TaxID=2893891 RepID=UPI001E2C4E0C|nr:SurA N-terminal domain-containing protein [Kitasatospora humi]MCC9312024.1 SurA N-terminal domain-containing protein [Kitasatospora humi]
MIRSSSVRRTLPALGVLLGTLALSACGSQPPRPGAAALVGSDRITVAQVEARVAEFRAQAAQLPSGQYQEQAGLVGATVYGMVFDQVVARALADHQLSVTDTEVAQLREQEVAALGGEAALEQNLLLRNGVPTQEIDGYLREQLGLQKLAKVSGQQLGTTDGNQAVHQLLTTASEELRVTVNPRYGTWDPAQAVLDNPSEPWLPQSGAAA